MFEQIDPNTILRVLTVSFAGATVRQCARLFCEFRNLSHPASNCFSTLEEETQFVEKVRGVMMGLQQSGLLQLKMVPLSEPGPGQMIGMADCDVSIVNEQLTPPPYGKKRRMVIAVATPEAAVRHGGVSCAPESIDVSDLELVEACFSSERPRAYRHYDATECWRSRAYLLSKGLIKHDDPINAAFEWEGVLDSIVCMPWLHSPDVAVRLQRTLHRLKVPHLYVALRN